MNFDLELREEGGAGGEEEATGLAQDDAGPTLYIHRGAVMKVLGATVRLDTQTCQPVLYAKEGHVLQPHT